MLIIKVIGDTKLIDIFTTYEAATMNSIIQSVKVFIIFAISYQ